jgi:hypothetical protein
MFALVVPDIRRSYLHGFSFATRKEETMISFQFDHNSGLEN